MISQILTLFFFSKKMSSSNLPKFFAIQCSLFPMPVQIGNGPLCKIYLLLLVSRWLPLSAASTSLFPLSLSDLSASSGNSTFLTHADHFYGSLYLNYSYLIPIYYYTWFYPSLYNIFSAFWWWLLLYVKTFLLRIFRSPPFSFKYISALRNLLPLALFFLVFPSS